ncbi:MAG: SDR family oxidoreductase [Clostridia bacterium]|nr:SDR family oxidoreductase [Clostridia bacterium]
MDKKVIFITGGSSGIGRSCAEYLAAKGHTVVATTRHDVVKQEEKVGQGSILMVTLDVTKPDTISEAVSYTIDTYQRIDVLINNAGFGIAGAIEDTSDKEMQAQFNVNFFGAVRMTNQLLPVFRMQGKGQIINIGSVAGYVSIPFQAMYSACKASLLAYSKALRNEVKPFGIKVTLVEPGDLKTSFTDSRQITIQSDGQSAYSERFKNSISVMEHDERTGGDPVIIAKSVEKILRSKNPPVAVTVGLKYKVFKFLFRVLPVKLSEKVIYSIYAK